MEIAKMKKPITLAKLDEKLWKIFSEFIRLRDANENGYGQCVTCGKWLHWTRADAGHYWPKGAFRFLKFEEKNVGFQCGGCNRFKEGNQVLFREYLIRKYGEKIVSELDESRHYPGGFTREGYIMRIKEYTVKVKSLKRQKGVM